MDTLWLDCFPVPGRSASATATGHHLASVRVIHCQGCGRNGRGQKIMVLSTSDAVGVPAKAHALNEV